MGNQKKGKITQIRNFIGQEIQILSNLLNVNSPQAKQKLHRHISIIAMHPVENERKWFYAAEGGWNLLGTDENAPREEPRAQDSNEGQLRMVAGAGFEPATFGL